jgi:hypothetical protein
MYVSLLRHKTAEENLEQLYAIKLCVKLGEGAADTFYAQSC